MSITRTLKRGIGSQFAHSRNLKEGLGKKLSRIFWATLYLFKGLGSCTTDSSSAWTSTWVIGRFTWDTIDVTFRDPIGPSAAQALMEWVRLHSESVTGRQGYAAGYKKDIELELLDPTGVVIEKWILQGTMLTNVDFGSLDY